MPKIINAFQGTSPIAETLTRLGDSLWGDKVGGQLAREKAYGLQRQNTEMGNLMRRVAERGSPALANDPIAHGMALGADVDPKTLGGFGLLHSAVENGAKASATQNLQVGSGQPYSSTFGATEMTDQRLREMAEADRAAKRWEWEHEPVAAMEGGEPAFVPQGSLTSRFDVQPALSQDEWKALQHQEYFDQGYKGLNDPQSRALGVEPDGAGTTWNWITPEGTFQTTDENFAVGQDARGDPLPRDEEGNIVEGYRGNVDGTAEEHGLTNASETDAQADVLQAEKTLGQIRGLRQVISENPASVGALGATRGALQNLEETFRVLSSHMGDETVSLGQQAEGTGFGSLFGDYDASIPAVHFQGTALTYGLAAAVADQEGRSLSDIDRQIWADALGAMQSFWSLETAKSLTTRLSIAEAIVMEHGRLAALALERGVKFDPEGANSVLPQAINNVMANPGAYINDVQQNDAAPQPNQPSALDQVEIISVEE